MDKSAAQEKDSVLVDRLIEAYGKVRGQLSKIIVGQDAVIEQLMVALFARGHCVVVGVPGLAKTLLISSLARILDLQFRRIQFTPDLMPSDITGTDVLQEDPITRERTFRFAPGPVFANIVLADEINRTPPKTQSALLQAMQEYQVTVMGKTHPLPLPFFVLATQNPIEQEGTYPLPEAQLDRFLFQINIDYPSAEEEKEIVLQTTGGYAAELQKVLDAEAILRLQEVIRKVPVAENVVEKTVALVRRTRPQSGAEEFVKDWISWGAGPRASQALILGAKARCILNGRFAVSWDDVLALCEPVLRHRLILSFRAEAEGVRVRDVIQRLLKNPS
ncbi:MAG TPA: MoxR family ATPase [Elusimicrobiota bacterium]|nr:MoxR family ATPase [Elusimicrobiota bacterium]